MFAECILKLGAAGWNRTNIVYLEGPDLQSGDAHALASTTALFFNTLFQMCLVKQAITLCVLFYVRGRWN